MSIWPTMDFMDSISSGIGSKGGANPFSYLARSQAQGERDVQKQAFAEDAALALENQEKLINFENTHTLSQQVAGARAAGLSPLAALSGKVNFAPAGSASSASSSSPKGGSETIAGIMQGVSTLLSQRLVKAQADNLFSQTVGQDIKNQHELDKDAAIQANLRRMFAKLEDRYKDNPKMLEGLKELGSSDMSASFGSLQGMREFVKLNGEMSQNAKDMAQNKFEKLLYREMTKNEAFKDKAQMPRLEFERMAQEIYKAAQEIVNLRLQALNIAQDTSTKKSQESLNYETIEKLAQEITSIYHGDYAAMWKNDDYSAMFIKLAAEATQSAASAAGFAVAGRAAGLGRAGMSIRNKNRPPILNNPPLNTEKHIEQWNDKRGHFHHRERTNNAFPSF